MGRSLYRILSSTFLICTSALAATRMVPQIDTLQIRMERPATWNNLKAGEIYRCVADENRGIDPYDINWGEEFSPGVFTVIGSPGSAVLIGFRFPDTLRGTAAGTVMLTYTDSSLGLADSAHWLVREYFWPGVPVRVTLNAEGFARFTVAADVTTSYDATEGDTFIGNGSVIATYADTASGPPSANAQAILEFDATIAAACGELRLDPEDPCLRWHSVRPGIRYACTVDSTSNIEPVDADNPERFTPCTVTITGSPHAQIELSFQLPSKLRTRRGEVGAAVTYDSALAVAGEAAGHAAVLRKFDPSDTLLLSLDDEGRATVTVAASPEIFAGVAAGDTLSAQGTVKIEYTGLAKRGGAALPEQQNHREIRLEAIVAQPPALSQNYPNPFNPSTTIEYWIQSAHHVRLAIYDLLGREVALLVDRDMDQGSHTVSWSGDQVSGGIYFSRLTVGRSQTTRKLVLIR